MITFLKFNGELDLLKQDLQQRQVLDLVDFVDCTKVPINITYYPARDSFFFSHGGQRPLTKATVVLLPDRINIGTEGTVEWLGGEFSYKVEFGSGNWLLNSLEWAIRSFYGEPYLLDSVGKDYSKSLTIEELNNEYPDRWLLLEVLNPNLDGFPNMGKGLFKVLAESMDQGTLWEKVDDSASAIYVHSTATKPVIFSRW